MFLYKIQADLIFHRVFSKAIKVRHSTLFKNGIRCNLNTETILNFQYYSNWENLNLWHLYTEKQQAIGTLEELEYLVSEFSCFNIGNSFFYATTKVKIVKKHSENINWLCWLPVTSDSDENKSNFYSCGMLDCISNTDILPVLPMIS